jgi:hypothetical protein
MKERKREEGAEDLGTFGFEFSYKSINLPSGEFGGFYGTLSVIVLVWETEL